MLRTIIILLIFTVSCFAGKTETYLVYLNKLPDPSVIKTKGILTLKDAGGQPARLTIVMTSLDLSGMATYYALVTITCKDSQTADKTYLVTAVTNGIIKLINTQEEKRTYHSELGGNVSWIEVKEINLLPDDFWKVKKSTP